MLKTSGCRRFIGCAVPHPLHDRLKLSISKSSNDLNPSLQIRHIYCIMISMLSLKKAVRSIAFRFSSEIHLVKEVLQIFEKDCNRLKIEESSSLILVLRELLINAVVHGNRNVAERTVQCVVERLDGCRFKIHR